MDIIREDVAIAGDELRQLDEDGFCKALGPAEAELLTTAQAAVAEIGHELEDDDAD
jgi:hypothetical protein